ncbi:MAG TPA: TIGR00730 family Rossman fold protein [Verrucomicrobiae bacterium]
MKSVCVFCGSSHGFAPEYEQMAKEMGRAIAARGWTLVYGGGNVGLMGVVADAALAAGGKVIGVIPEALLARELGHRGVTELRVVDTMHERKAMMAELADGFIALPGGIGTFEEFFEVLTWAQLGIHHKPCGLINTRGYYQPVMDLLGNAVKEGFLKAEHQEMVLTAEGVEEMLARMETHKPPQTMKWIRKSET